MSMEKFYIVSGFCLLLSLTACTMDPWDSPGDYAQQVEYQLAQTIAEVGGKSAFRFPSVEDIRAIPQDERNPLTLAKIELGKHLFHETGIGRKPRIDEGMYTYSCASCHHAGAGFQAGIAQGIGEGGMGFGLAGETRTANPMYPVDSMDIQPIRSPSALNVAYQEVMLWNGQFGAKGLNEGTEASWADGTPIAVNHLGYEGVEIQAIAGLAVHRLHVDSQVVADIRCQELFDQAFADIPQNERYSNEFAGLAIAAYERTLLAREAPFQRWLAGEEEALDPMEKAGAILFFGKAGCVSCHQGPALNEMNFYALGMNDLEGPGIYGGTTPEATRLGRGGFTQQPADYYKFKVPQLYNLKDSPFLGHGATFRSVKEVISYKNQAEPENANVPVERLDPQFSALGLTEQEVIQITRFVENGLYDPALERYVPVSNPSGMCFPNGDDRSRQDLGCQ